MTSSAGVRGARRLASSFLEIRPQRGQARRAVRPTFYVGAALIVVSVVYGPLLGALGMIGAMTGTVARDAPMRRRIITLGVAGAVMLGCAWLGMHVANTLALYVPLVTGLTVVIVWAWHAMRVGPPGPINLLFASAFGGHLVTVGYTPSRVLPVTALAFSVSAATSIVLFALDMHAPEDEAVDAADEAVSTYRDRPADLDENDANQLRSEAYVAIEDAWDVLHENRVPLLQRTPRARAMHERLKNIHLCLVEVLQSEAFPASPPDIAQNFDAIPKERPSVGYLLRTGLGRGSRSWLAAKRAGLAVLLASAVTTLSPVGRPYWAILSALIILHLQAPRVDLTVRAVHRVVGTALGLLVYFAVISAHPSPWVGVAVVIGSVYAMNCFVARNYALGVVFITVYALLMVPLTPAEDVTTVMGERLLETVIGTLAAVVSVWVLGRRAPVLLVRGQYRRTLHAIEEVLADQAVGNTRTSRAQDHQRNLLFELERAGEILSSQRNDDPGLDAWLGVQHAVSRFGFDVLAGAWRTRDGADLAAARAWRDLGVMISALPPLSGRDIDQAAFIHRITVLHDEFLAGVRT